MSKEGSKASPGSEELAESRRRLSEATERIYSDTGMLDPEEAARILKEHFDNVTFEEFAERNRRANPHMYGEPSAK